MRIITTALILLLSASYVSAKKIPPTRDENVAAVHVAYSNNMALYAEDDDMMVREALLANRKEKWVKFNVESTGLTAKDHAEFLIVGLTSGHAYEALLVSFALAEDIHEALEFIGMEAGSVVSIPKLQFWPKGERVILSAEWQDADKVNNIRVEKLMVNREKQATFPEDGFIFVGSAFRASMHTNTVKYAADHYEPKAIAAHYNDPETVLDVPRMAQQDHVYSHQFPNPDYLMPTGALIQITMRPEYTDGRKRVQELNLKVEPGEKGKDLAFSLTESDGTVLRDKTPLAGLLAEFEKSVAANRDPFVRLTFAENLTLSTAHGFCNFLSNIESDRGIRIDSPAAGTLYYRAFLPPEEMRDRDKRYAQPWEYHMTLTNDTFEGRLIYIDEVKASDGSGWTNVVTEYEATTPAQITEVLSMTNKFGMPLGIPVTYVYVDEKAKYGQLMSAVDHILPLRATVYVYLESSDQ